MEALQLSQTVMDEYAARILLGTSQVALSAQDLSRRYGIPIAACYRRLRELQDAGLVFCERELPSRNGKGLQMFRSRLRAVRVSFEEGRFRAQVEVASELAGVENPHVAEQELRLADLTKAQ